MSGDLQARKRNKDKKKRKDDDVKEKPASPTPSGVHSTKMGPEDIQLHVHSDHGTGGHWCAKLVFFSLMAVLLGLIGLILLENRGLSDLDTPLSESRYADILEGWVDEERESHDVQHLDELDDHGDGEAFSEEEDHDEDDDTPDNDEEGTHDEQTEESEEHILDQDDGVEIDDNANDADADSAEVEEVEEVEDTTDAIDDASDDEGFEDADTENENDNADEENDDGENTDGENDDGENDDEENEDGENENVEDNKALDDDENNDPFDETIYRKTLDLKNVKSTPTSKTVDSNGVSEQELESQVESPSKVTVRALEKQVDELFEDFNKLAETLDLPKVNPSINRKKTELTQESVKRLNNKRKEEDDNNSVEEVIDNDDGEELHLKKLAQKDEASDEQEADENDETESGSIAVKIVVGLALLVVAYQVLVRKSQTTEGTDYEEQLAAVKRRLTLVDDALTSGVDDEQLENEEEIVEEYEESDDEEELLEDEKDISEIEDDEAVIKDMEERIVVPRTYEQMEAMYKPARRSIGELVIPKNIGPTLIETKVEQIATMKPKTIQNPEQERKLDPKLEAKSVPKEPLRPLQPTELKTEPKRESGQTSGINPQSQTGRDAEHVSDEEDLGEEEQYDEEYTDEEYTDDEEDISDDVDDTDLLERLEAKYGKLPQRDSDDEGDDLDPTWTRVSRSGPAGYHEDADIVDELRAAQDRLDDYPNIALSEFETLLKSHPRSPSALCGRAKALDRLAEKSKSNSLVRQAIDAYIELIQQIGPQLTDKDFIEIAQRCIERQRFLGRHKDAVVLHEELIERFPNEPYYRNQLAVTHLLSNSLSDAKYVLHETLLRWRDNGFAAVHYGFVLKTLDNDLENAVIFLRQGIESRETDTNDGRFYFHLGDALARLGRTDEARKVYVEGAAQKVFLSKDQRSLYNVNRLSSRPFWSVAQSSYKKLFRILEENWKQIRDEAFSALNEEGYFVDEAESLRDFGNWKQLELFARGQKNSKNCQKATFTCKLIETFPEARFCKRGQVKFSVMHPNTHVWPHCGPTNCRLRAHLGLRVPPNTYLRVANETRTWEDGKILIFDDSYEHEVWHNGTSVRVVFIVDVWHPDLSEEERSQLYPI